MLTSPPRYSRPDLPPLDEADRKLIETLLKDGRASGRKLALETGLSEANVSRRLSRLVEEQTIRIRCWVPPQLLGYRFQGLLLLRIERDHEQIADRMRRSGGMVWITGTIGLYDMVAYCCVRGAGDMLTIIDQHVLGVPGVRSATLVPMLEFHTPILGFPTGEQNRTGRKPPEARELDETDLAVIGELQRDGRLSYADLAQRVGISATSAADRFRRLQADGIVEIVTFVDPPRVGQNLSGAFLIAASGPLRPLMRRLAECPELALLTVLAGEYAGYVAFNCADEAHYEDLRTRIVAMEGVHDVRPLLFSRLYHESVVWGDATGDEPAASSGATGRRSATRDRGGDTAASASGTGRETSGGDASGQAPRADPGASVRRRGTGTAPARK